MAHQKIGLTRVLIRGIPLGSFALGRSAIVQNWNFTKNLVYFTRSQSPRVGKRVDLSKIELNKEMTELADVVEEVVARYQTDGANLPEISVQKPKYVVAGKWDRCRLEQVIGNLLSNAIKYGDGKPVEIVIEGDAETQVAQVCVTDHGIGIAYEAQESIFNKFERAQEVQNISGLGLDSILLSNLWRLTGGISAFIASPKKDRPFLSRFPLFIVKRMPPVQTYLFLGRVFLSFKRLFRRWMKATPMNAKA